MENSTVQCWGGNTYGQLGRGAASDPDPAPETVVDLTDVSAVSAGGAHTCALLSDGTIYCWGENANKQIGNEDTSLDFTEPQSITGIDNAIDISCGKWHTCALLANSAVVCWGDNWHGQLGNNSYKDSALPVEIEGMYH
jgi:alpha-tubulin suppressor-like RCC1 family protein